jgi:integrase
MSHHTKSASPSKPDKPRPDYPLFAHDSGQWAKKIRKKLHYFGSWRLDPEGKTALETFEREWPYLKEGKTPPPIDISGGCTIRQLCNDILKTKKEAVKAGELSPRTFRDYYQICELLVDQFGKDRTVEDLTPADFRDFRAKLAAKYNVVTLKSTINRCSVVFKYALDSNLIEKPVNYGQAFKRPSAKVQRREKNQAGPKMFSRDEIRRILEAADVHIRAMAYLGVNCAFGNSDVAHLPQAALDLEGGWVSFPRVKTEIPRRIPLWPETVKTLRESLAKRPEPRKRSDAHLCFLTIFGQPWVRMKPKPDVEPSTAGDKKEGKPAVPIDSVNLRFRKLLKDLELNGRRGLGFYTLRHVFETIGGEAKDQVAVDAIMGHVDSTMGGNYRQMISDDRLLAVVNTVRAWLFPPEVKAAEGGEGGAE